MNVWLSCVDLAKVSPPFTCCGSCHDDMDEGYPGCEREPERKRRQRCSRPINPVLAGCCTGPSEEGITREMWARMLRAKREGRVKVGGK